MFWKFHLNLISSPSLKWSKALFPATPYCSVSRRELAGDIFGPELDLWYTKRKTLDGGRIRDDKLRPSLSIQCISQTGCWCLAPFLGLCIFLKLSFRLGPIAHMMPIVNDHTNRFCWKIGRVLTGAVWTFRLSRVKNISVFSRWSALVLVWMRRTSNHDHIWWWGSAEVLGKIRSGDPLRCLSFRAVHGLRNKVHS